MGFDVYNMADTGNVAKTLNAIRSDTDHVPVVVFKERAGCPGGGKGILIGKDRMFTLATSVIEGICYSIQGNVIDRASGQNGNGCSKDVSHVLNATDRHGVCYLNSSGDGIATTLDSHYFKGCGEREGIEREYVAYERIPSEDRSIMCEQPSGELHRTGCVQRYAPGVQEKR